jgi:hypothetical protein
MKTNTDTEVKTGIKLRVNPEQSKKIQEICFANNISWHTSGYNVVHERKPFLFIGDDKELTYRDDEKFFNNVSKKEIDPELFIRTKGTCIEPLETSNQIDSKPKPNLKIRDEFIPKVQNEKVGVICNTLEELRAWYIFLDKHMDKSLHRWDTNVYINENILNMVISNNVNYGNICEWNKNNGFYEKKGFSVYAFKDIIEEHLTEIPKETHYLVMVKGKGQPKKVHASLESAEKEAQRLAQKEIQNGEGKEVFVLEVLKKYKAIVSIEEV